MGLTMRMISGLMLMAVMSDQMKDSPIYLQLCQNMFNIYRCAA
jgi:hypothetical protein